jgi:hypothetical protein
MFLLINYCSDMFRPQFLDSGRELITLCSLYVNSSGRSFYVQYTIKIINKIGLNIEILNISLHNIKSFQLDNDVIRCVQTL